jgi:sigma-B regulation protein RsbU (phosphoserine phosphatase)
MTEMAETLQKKNREMEEELRLAREVQQALIPGALPSMVAGTAEGEVSLKFKHLYRPASELAGDFFEVLPLENDRMGFIVSDVMGHGVRSALVVSMLRGLIEQQADSAGDSAEFLTGLNDGLTHLLEESGVVLFATAVYGVVDLRNDTVQISNAGHPNPIAGFEDGIRQLAPPPEASGPALGLVQGYQYGSVTAPLRGLRRMICFTDGVFEVLNEWKEEFGIDHIIEVIERGGSLERVLEHLVESAEKFAGPDGFDDDLCLLGLEVER